MTRFSLWCVVLLCRLLSTIATWVEGVAMDRIGQLVPTDEDDDGDDDTEED